MSFPSPFTSISSARDASQLVSILLHGVITLGEPDCSSSHLWISALDTTFSANDGGEMEKWGPALDALGAKRTRAVCGCGCPSCRVPFSPSPCAHATTAMPCARGPRIPTPSAGPMWDPHYMVPGGKEKI